MRIQVEKFLALTALLATGSVLSVGCVTEDTKTDTDAGISGGGGAGGSGGSSTGGTGGVAGAAGGGGAAGAAGGGGVAGAAGGGGTDGGACLGDTGVENDCSKLAYAATVCGDAGAEGLLLPLGYELCGYVAGMGRLGIQKPIWDCLSAITGDACAAAHDTAVQKCIDDVFPNACQHAPLPDGDGGTYDPCKDVASTCAAVDGGTAGITEAECNGALNPLSASAVTFVLTCYDTGTGDCRDDFIGCVGLP